MNFYKISKWIMVGGIVGTYAVMYGLYALLYAIFGDAIGVAFVGICLVIVFNKVKELLGAKSILGYIVTFILSAIVGQFVAPFVLGPFLSNKIKYNMLLSEVASNATKEQLLKLKEDINGYLIRYKELENNGIKDAKFIKIKVNFFGFKDFFDVLYLNDEIDKRLQAL